MIQNFEQLLDAAASHTAPRALVVSPANRETFQAIQDARARLGVEFLLTGSRDIIQSNLPDRSGVEIIDSPDVASSVRNSMQALARGEAGILMKGGVDTATLLKAALLPESGLRTGNLLSDVFIFEYAARPLEKLVMITDGGLNIAPDLAAKAQIIRNAVRI